jgi:hypothetical protein
MGRACTRRAGTKWKTRVSGLQDRPGRTKGKADPHTPRGSRIRQVQTAEVGLASSKTHKVRRLAAEI